MFILGHSGAIESRSRGESGLIFWYFDMRLKFCVVGLLFQYFYGIVII